MSSQNPVFIPGPTNIPDRLRAAMNVQTLDHRSPEFVNVFAPVLDGVKKVFGTTDGTVITFPGSGHRRFGKRRSAIRSAPAIRFWSPATVCSATAGLICANATVLTSRLLNARGAAAHLPTNSKLR